jgi:hypothetical protein
MEPDSLHGDTRSDGVSPVPSEASPWRKAAWGLVIALGGVVAWGVKKVVQEATEDGAVGLLAWTGRTGEALFLLVCGLGLLIAGPICIARMNHTRLLQERKPKYGLLEKTIVVVGGLAFTAFGAALLFWKG